MRALTDTEALALWEMAQGRAPAARAYALLAAVSPDAEVLADVPVGARNVRLLDARARTFGPLMPCEARCPACAEKLEFTLATDAFASDAPPASPLQVEVEGQCYTFRLPSDADLLAILGEGGDAADLRARCALSPPPDVWPDAALDAAEARMDEADPLAVLTLDLTCPACGHAWAESFDPAAFLFDELMGCGQRALADVHRLARAYGWREADVLALSTWRRQQYIALVDG